MTSQIAAWRIADDEPVRASASQVNLEKSLEGWIEHDPSLVREGMSIVGRQLRVEGGVLDLLGVDAQGRWVVIEVKRTRLYREALAQALDYASSIAEMPGDALHALVVGYLGSHGIEDPEGTAARLTSGDEEGRDVAVAVVGTGADAGLTRVVSFLSERSEVPISVITLHVFDDAAGTVLVRELTEADEIPVQDGGPKLHMFTVEELVRKADQEGISPGFRALVDAGVRNGLHLRPYRKAIMCTPPTNWTRLLYVFRTIPARGGRVQVCPVASGFAEFFPVDEREVEERLGPSDWQYLDDSGVQSFIDGLDDLARVIDTRGAQAD